MRRIVPVALTGLLLAVTGCSGPPAIGARGDVPQSGPGADGRTTISWLQWYAGEQGWDVLDSVRDAFEADHPDIALEIQDIPSSQAHDKIVTLNLADRAPDVITTSQITMTEFASAGILEPLADRMEAVSLDYPERFADGTLAQWDGEYWGVPITNGPVAMFYNKTILDEAGAAVPTDWNEFADVAEKVRATGKYATTGNLSSSPPYSITYEIWPYILQAGGDLIDEDGQPAFDSPEAADALRYLRDLQIDRDTATPGILNSGEQVKRDNFSGGNTAFMFENPGGINQLRRVNPDLDYGIAPMPAGAERSTINQGTMISVAAGSRHKDAAWTFVEWMGSARGAEVWSSATNFFPANDEVIASDRVVDDARLSVFSDIFADSERVELIDNRIPRAYELRRLFTLQMQRFFDGQISAEEALAEAEAAWNAVITRSPDDK